jgi:uncharacterized protein with HEPN domain
MNPNDIIRLRHMLEAAQIARSLSEGESRASLETDLKLQLALTRTIEIIGEAVANVSDETRTAYPSVPWKNMVGMRNILIHKYFNVDLDTLWSTVTNDLEPLIKTLESILA